MEFITTSAGSEVKTCSRALCQVKGPMHLQPQEKWLGLLDYNRALDLQKEFSEQARRSEQIFILGCEHPTVITHGARVKTSDKQEIQGVPTVKTNRGGLATLHSPGQLVIYPIAPLRTYDFNVRDWVEYLMKVTVNSLHSCNIIIINQNKGAFTKNGKIASVGINVSKGISTHGIAINVSNNLRLFEFLSPCGIANQAMDKVENYVTDLQSDTLFKIWFKHFKAGLQYSPNRLTETSSMNRT
jgi:lipoyl(octanoyl) transferase